MFEFRVWIIKSKEYFKPGKVTGFHYFEDKITIWYLDDDDFGLPNYKKFHITGIILEQYTGRKDLNKKKIFVNDKNNQGEFCIWDKDDLGYKWQEIKTGYVNDFDHLHGDPKIIGNIHEAKNV